MVDLFIDATGLRHGSRSYLTCLNRCGSACDQPEANPTAHEHIQDVIATAVRRRSVLAGAAIGSAALVLGPPAAVAAAAPVGGRLGRVPFTPVRPNRRDAVVTPDGFDHTVVIRWGDPVVPGAPPFDVDNQTPAAAMEQFGYNCDYVGVLPIDGDSERAILVVNHEYTVDQLMFPSGRYTATETRALAMIYHGMSVVTIKKGLVPGSWLLDKRATTYNRRIHVETEFVVDGPAAGDDRLKTTADPTGRRVLGTINNCAGGMTPWGTVLSGEENVNTYFDKSGALDPRYTAEYARYGVTGTGKGWMAVDPRFDLTTEPHEPHRFGWIVEVDPFRPGSTPVKHSMLGRFKHEGANIILAKDGRAVAYMGDDERGDYIYKFVSRDKVDARGTRAARRHNKQLLSAGTLYVARFTGDGTEDGIYDGAGEWLPLCSDTESHVEGMSVADVLIFTRIAADTLGPTRMDRPEDVEPNLVNGKVYAALSNNLNRGSAGLPVDEANPLATSMVRTKIGAPLITASGNRNGYVLELTAASGDHARTSFTWDLLLVCGDPEAVETYFGGYDKTKVSPISAPDNVTFDSDGNLWVSTDGNALGSNDGIFRVPVTGADRGRVQQFVTLPRGAEACGPLIADGDRSLFFAVQHPGELDGATFENQLSTWPHTDDFPRPGVCVAYRQR